MTKYIATILTIVLLSGILSSCNSADEKDHPFNYIDIEFFEQFSSSGSSLYFNIRTIETFPCSNFSLELIVSPTSGHTEIRVVDIDVPDVCITAMGPATFLLPLGPAINDLAGFSFWVNDKRHDFQLKTEDKSITIVQGSPFENHLFFAYDSLLRIPSNTVWGYALFDQSEKGIDIWEQIMLAFADLGAKEMILPNGYYYFFNVKETIIHFDNVKQEAKTFYFQFDQPIELLIEIYERIMAENEQADIQLRLFDTSGERFVL